MWRPTYRKNGATQKQSKTTVFQDFPTVIPRSSSLRRTTMAKIPSNEYERNWQTITVIAILLGYLFALLGTISYYGYIAYMFFNYREESIPFYAITSLCLILVYIYITLICNQKSNTVVYVVYQDIPRRRRYRF